MTKPKQRRHFYSDPSTGERHWQALPDERVVPISTVMDLINGMIAQHFASVTDAERDV